MEDASGNASGLGVLMNTCGLLLGIPFGIVIGLDLPQYPQIIALALACATVFLYSAKRPAPLDRVGWILLGIHVIGYGVVTLANFAVRPVPGGPITICLTALAVIVVLAAYPGHVHRRREKVHSVQSDATATSSLTSV